jgi:hypothetical protein
VPKGYPAPAAAPATATAGAPAPAAPSAREASAVASTPAPSTPPSPPSSPSGAKREAKPDKDSAAPANATAGVGHAETLVQRADRLFTEGRWVEAAVAYRDLLRQTPSSSDAPRWRRRLSAAEGAAAADRTSP